MNNPFRWRLGALASAIALLGSFSSFDTQAMALGRITVQSALGEPLKAEIDIADINAEEAASLKAGAASAEAFRAAGLDYTSAMAELRVSLQRRANGSAYLRLSTTRPVTEPFVDLILEANWSSGRIVRDYTMLFDPPSLRGLGTAGSSVTPSAPTIAASPSTSARPAPAPLAAPPAPVAQRPAAVARSAPLPLQAPPAAAAAAAVKPPAAGQVTVKAGDTAGKIAAQNKPASVSLDQMLVALLTSNPDAFISGNVNRLKSGAVLDLPGADAASALSPSEASRTIVAQAKNFNDFRRNLAQSVPEAQVSSANRQASGQLQTQVEDRTAATVAPDKLTLSKGAVQGKAAAEEKIARDRQASEASTRVAELAKNIGDLNKIAGVPAVAAPPSIAKATGTASTSASSGPNGQSVQASAAPVGITVPSTTPPIAAPASGTALPAAAPLANAPPVTAAAPAAPGSAAAVASTAATAALTPASAAASGTNTTAISASQVAPGNAASAPVTVAAVKTVAVPVPFAEPSLIDEITENPLILPGLAALLALLAGFGIYRYRQSNNPAQVDSSFLESRLQPDSFFGASGGQRIDTSEGAASGSSLVYSPSQLDAAGDVDPVAEADVYLAYGRDLQAEEILKEAMRTTPGRVAIHAKLMEIYAKRRDAKAFEVVAAQAFTLTRGEGPDWAYISEMGRDLDHANPMYQPGGQPEPVDKNDDGHVASAAAAFGSSTLPQMQAPSDTAAGPLDFDLDLDLDFSTGDEHGSSPRPSLAPAAAVATPVRKPEPSRIVAPERELAFEGLDLDFEGEFMESRPAIEPVNITKKPALHVKDADAELSAHILAFDITPSATRSREPQKEAAVMDMGMLEFDMDSLSLDLDSPVKPNAARLVEVVASTPVVNDPLETKFSLAEEFRALGDMDGARSLAEEVEAEASGALKNKAQVFLNALS